MHHFLDHLHSRRLPPRAHALFLVLLAKAGEHRDLIASYEELGPLIGSTRAGSTKGNRDTVAKAGHELEAAGLIGRERQPHPVTGATNGPGTPYAWTFRTIDAEALLGDGRTKRSVTPARPRWSPAQQYVLDLVPLLPTLGPGPVTLASRLAYLVDEEGALHLPIGELGRRTLFDPKTVESHLKRLEPTLAVWHELDFEGPRKVVEVKVQPREMRTDIALSRACGILSPERLNTKATNVTREQVAKAAEDLWYRDELKKVVKACEGELTAGRKFSPAQVLQLFVQPTLDLQERWGNAPLVKYVLDQGVRYKPARFDKWAPAAATNNAHRFGGKRLYKTNAEVTREASPETAVEEVRALLRAAGDEYGRGGDGQVHLDEALTYVDRVAPVFGGDHDLARASIFEAVKQGVSDFVGIDPKNSLGLDFLPGWEWPSAVATPAHRKLEEVAA